MPALEALTNLLQHQVKMTSGGSGASEAKHSPLKKRAASALELKLKADRGWIDDEKVAAQDIRTVRAATSRLTPFISLAISSTPRVVLLALDSQVICKHGRNWAKATKFWSGDVATERWRAAGEWAGTGSVRRGTELLQRLAVYENTDIAGRAAKILHTYFKWTEAEMMAELVADRKRQQEEAWAAHEEEEAKRQQDLLEQRQEEERQQQQALVQQRHQHRQQQQKPQPPRQQRQLDSVATTTSSSTTTPLPADSVPITAAAGAEVIPAGDIAATGAITAAAGTTATTAAIAATLLPPDSPNTGTDGSSTSAAATAADPAHGGRTGAKIGGGGGRRSPASRERLAGSPRRRPKGIGSYQAPKSTSQVLGHSSFAAHSRTNADCRQRLDT